MKHILKLIPLLHLNYRCSLLYNQVLSVNYQNLKILIIFSPQAPPSATCNSEATKPLHFQLWHKHLRIPLLCEGKFYGYIFLNIIL